MRDVFTIYLELSIRLSPDVARYVVENYIKRKNIKVIENCCRLYNHYIDIIKFNQRINYCRTIRIQMRVSNITLIFHNVIFPTEGKNYRVDAIVHKKNINMYVLNFTDGGKDSITFTDKINVKNAERIILDIKEGLFDDFPLMLALSKQIV